MTIVCCNHTNINGIDISHHNKVQWEKLSPNIKYCYIKASEGAKVKDPMRYKNHKQATKHNLKVGFYHFYRNVPAKQQFDNFVEACPEMELRPAIDIEIENINNSNLRQLISLMQQHYGVKPIVYVGNVACLNNIPFDTPLWIRCLGKLSYLIPNIFGKQTMVENNLDYNYFPKSFIIKPIIQRNNLL